MEKGRVMETAVAGLDIGSSRIVVAVAIPRAPAPGGTATGESAHAWILPAAPVPGGFKTGTSDTMGLRRGQVGDVPALSRSIRGALSRAESAAGARVESACIGLSGHSVEFYRKKYGNLIGKRRINHQDIERIRRLALVSDLPPGRRVIQALPLEFLVDGIAVGGEPIGAHCSRLEVECLVVTADAVLVDRLMDAVHGAGVRVTDIFPSSMAEGAVLLTRAQQQLGTALVDMGGAFTGILVYNHGHAAEFEVLPVGGDHITSDLAICLRTTLAGAEEVKKTVGLGLKISVSGGGGMEKRETEGSEGFIAVPRLSGSGVNEVPGKTYAAVVGARICEILDMVASAVKRLAGGIDLPGGLVLTGGGSLLKGLGPFAEEHLGAKVQISGGSGAAGAEGLLRFCLGRCRRAGAGRRPSPGLWGRVGGFFKAPI